MTTTSASTAAPKPVEAPNKPAQANARAHADKPAEPDLFASLLSLVGDTHVPPAAATPPEAETASGKGEAPADGKTENPLAALLAWAMPTASAPAGAGGNATDAKTTAATNPATLASGIDKALAETGVNIDGMTRVDEAAPAPTAPTAAALARAAAASRPAFSPLHPSGTQPTPRAGEATASHGGAPAMVWQRGAGTEALQQSHFDPNAPVRSTVALAERFGFAGAPEAGAPPLREAGNTTPPGSPAAPGAGLDASRTVNATSGTDTASGDTTREGPNEPIAGDAQPFADASAEAEGPTVSHWGTQHMRHASLRVGGEGSADAIDIQLSVKGQEVQVAFQTDSAEARASLRESAGESLADLMQRSGIQLGSVSVGGQGQAQGEGAPPPRTIDLGTGNGGRGAPVAEPGARPAIAARLDGSRPLDVFA